MKSANAKRLMEHVDEFALCMKARLMEEDGNMLDWDNPAKVREIKDKMLVAAANANDPAPIDVACYAMFVWFHTPDVWDAQMAKINAQLETLRQWQEEREAQRCGSE